MKKLLLLLAFLCIGASVQNGQLIDNPVKYPGFTQKNYFCTPTAIGAGDCLSWDTACTFRTAVAKLSSSYTTTIFLSAGAHDTNNGVDATGTTISTSYVHICGAQPSTPSPVTRLVNSYATASHVLRITGANNFISDIAFGNSDQTDKNVVMLNLRANYQEVSTCSFTNSPGDGGGTGILVDNNALGTFIHDNNFFGVIDYGIEFGATTDAILKGNSYYSGGTAYYVSSASADRITSQNAVILGMTTGINYAAAADNSFYFIGTYFGNCTNNVAAVADYGNTFFESITESGKHSATYPATAGTQCDTGDGAWTWTVAATTVIPGDTITKPFKLTNINFQNWNTAQTFKIELLYGDGAATVSLGIFEVTLGDPAARSKVDTKLDLNVYLPAYSLVGAKVMSDTAGVDYVVVTLGYETL